MLFCLFTDFEFLLRFLRVKKYSQMAARESLENFITNIEEIPEWLGDLDPADEKLQDVLRLGYVEIKICLTTSLA